VVLEKDARNFLARTPYQLEETGLERELMGKVARMKLQYFGPRYQGKCRKFGTDSLGG